MDNKGLITQCDFDCDCVLPQMGCMGAIATIILNPIEPISYEEQESIPVGCVPPTCKPYVLQWPPPDVTSGGSFIMRPKASWIMVSRGLPPTAPPPNRVTDRDLRKHYLPANSLAGGNKSKSQSYRLHNPSLSM